MGYCHHRDGFVSIKKKEPERVGGRLPPPERVRIGSVTGATTGDVPRRGSAIKKETGR